MQPTVTFYAEVWRFGQWKVFCVNAGYDTVVSQLKIFRKHYPEERFRLVQKLEFVIESD